MGNIDKGAAIVILDFIKMKYENGLKNGQIGNQKYIDALQMAVDNLIHNNDTTTHGYWTGLLSSDYSHAEGLPSHATSEQREAYRDMFEHITHCSVCGGQFDSRIVRDWKGCPYCLSILDLEKPKDDKVLHDFENNISVLHHNTGSIVIESDRDRLINILNSSECTNLGGIIEEYLNRFGDEAISDYDCAQLMKTLSGIISRKLSKLNTIRSTSRDYASYLMKYFNDEMYNDDDAFVKYKDIQKKNVQSIIDSCDSK
jgi:hypothetical protein